MSVPLTLSPANVSRWLLVVAGLGANPLTVDPVTQQPTGAWPIYESNEPNLPDNCITLKNTLGHEFGRTQIDGEMLIHPGIQVRIRSSDEPTGWAKAEAIRRYMAEVAYQALLTIPAGAVGAGSTVLVYNFNNISQVLPLGKEPTVSKRSLFTINACVVLRQVTP